MSHPWFFRACALPKSRKTFGIRSFFYEKWLLPHVLAGPIDTRSYASIRFVSICPLTHTISFAYFSQNSLLASVNRGQHASRQDNFAVFYVILNRRTSSTPQSSALKTTKFSLPEVEESGTPRLRPCKALDRRVLDVRGARVTQQGHNLGAPDRVVPCPPTLV